MTDPDPRPSLSKNQFRSLPFALEWRVNFIGMVKGDDFHTRESKAFEIAQPYLLRADLR